MTQFYGTREVAGLLGIKPDTLQKAIWQNRVDPPAKGPGGAYLWTFEDINRASWVLRRRAYQPAENEQTEFAAKH